MTAGPPLPLTFRGRMSSPPALLLRRPARQAISSGPKRGLKLCGLADPASWGRSQTSGAGPLGA
jgi:hypothetical protein